MPIYEKNNYLTNEELDELLLLIQKQLERQGEIINKKPSEINRNYDTVERNKQQIRFNKLNQLYISPLIEFSKRICAKEGSTFTDYYSSSDFSILERTQKLHDFLYKKGISNEVMLKLVPKTLEEVDILIQASKQGFDLEFNNVANITNENRIERAKKHILIQEDIKENKEADNIGKTR